MRVDSICGQQRGLTSSVLYNPLPYRARLLNFFGGWDLLLDSQRCSLRRVYRVMVRFSTNLRQFSSSWRNPIRSVCFSDLALACTRESRRAPPPKVTWYQLGHIRKSILSSSTDGSRVWSASIHRLDEQIDFRCQTCRQSRRVWGSLIRYRYDSIPTIFPQEWHRIFSILFHHSHDRDLSVRYLLSDISLPRVTESI